MADRKTTMSRLAKLLSAEMQAGVASPHTTTTIDTCEPGMGNDGERLVVPRRCTLEGFADEASRQGGVDLAELPPLSRLEIKTQNTDYRVFALSPDEGKVLIHGGRFFAEPTEAYLCGSSYGGNLLKVAWVGVGMRLEVMRDGRRIVTSAVECVDVLDDSDIPGPF